MTAISDIDDLCTRLRSEEIGRQAFVDDCARLVCEAVRCSRAGLWSFAQGPAGDMLRCLGMFDISSGEMVQIEDRVAQHSRVFFDTLRREGSVIAVDASSHPATRDFYPTALAPHGIVSLMSVAFAFNGELFGALSCSQVGAPVSWSRSQLTTVSRIGTRAALALASVSPNHLSTFFGPIR